jgi:hypothetical protein
VKPEKTDTLLDELSKYFPRHPILPGTEVVTDPALPRSHRSLKVTCSCS